jgi:hypothetical protein
VVFAQVVACAGYYGVLSNRMIITALIKDNKNQGNNGGGQ